MTRKGYTSKYWHLRHCSFRSMNEANTGFGRSPNDSQAIWVIACRVPCAHSDDTSAYKSICTMDDKWTTRKKIGPLVIQHTFHISTFYISPLPKDGVARYFGCILYSLEILYVSSENHFDMISYRFLPNVELSKLVDMLSRHFKDHFVK